MQIICPALSANIKVTAGTICVRGTVDQGLKDVDFGAFVRVRVVNGFVALSAAPPPWPKLAGDVDVTPSGQNWLARGVPVPASSPVGSPLTVFAWQLIGSSGGGVAPMPVEQQFQGGGPNPIECCPASGSDFFLSGVLIAELASGADLLVTVSSGEHAGDYTATAVASLKWNVTIGGVPYTLVCADGASWTIHGPSSSAASTSFELDPFSATFPGHILDAADEIVVIVA